MLYILFFFLAYLNIFAINCDNIVDKLKIEVLYNSNRVKNNKYFNEFFPLHSALSGSSIYASMNFGLDDAPLYKKFLEDFEYVNDYDTKEKFVLYLKNIYFSKDNILNETKKELAHTLEIHGLTDREKLKSPYAYLDEQSAKNERFYVELLLDKLNMRYRLNINYKENISSLYEELTRYIKSRYSTSFHDVFNKIDGIEFKYLHASSIDKYEASSEFPLMSAKVLEGLGIIGLLNSRSPFTRLFLESSNNVFFSIIIGADNNYSEYGGYQYFLRESYADKYGMVSMGLMYPMNSFSTFAERYYPSDISQVSYMGQSYDFTGIGSTIINAYANNTLNTKTRSILEKIRARLYKFDFRTYHYRRLMKKLILLKMFEFLAKNDEGRYNFMYSLINNEDYSSLLSFVYRELGIDDFELKIPFVVYEKLMYAE